MFNNISAVSADAAAGSGLAIQLDGLGKSFGDRKVLESLDLTIPAGQFVALVGRSGCGKSTLLRLVAGLETPSLGDIRLDGAPLAKSKDLMRIMFQDPRLLPWKSVLENVSLGLEGSRATIRETALSALDQVGLADRAGEWPSHLSGGQRQRVALARALAHRPRLLLLDEPLGALDALTRIEMHALIERLWREEGFTVLLVTHDVSEAVTLADRVLLIENGAAVLDEPVPFPRPRERTRPGFATLEERILRRVIRSPSIAFVE
jgi:sulfonate transport system ATP-binding protein